MCGIIGYVGNRNASDVLLDGLVKLEYRGYDSAGIALFDPSIRIVKTAGKVAALKDLVSRACLPQSHCGIGHTRWATHGDPTELNAHPHRVGRVTLVHNGIVENYAQLREQYNLHPYSQTDTEIAAAVIDHHYNGNNPEAAIFKAVRSFHGAYALCILFSDRADTIYAIRNTSPLIVAKEKQGAFLASDISAVLPYTNQYYLPEKDELVILDKTSVRFVDQGLCPIEKSLLRADWSEEATIKNGYKHFMLKEIFESPAVLDRTLQRYQNEQQLFPDEPFDFSVGGRIHIVACGSAYHAGLMGKYAFEKLARLPVTVHLASEFRYDDPILAPEDLVIAISQSGETADTLAAMQLAKERGVRTLAIVNVRASSLAGVADHTFYTPAGPEIAVATTKAYLSQVFLLLLIALRFAEPRIQKQKFQALIDAVNRLPEQIKNILAKSNEIRAFTPYLRDAEHVFFMGRGQDYALALEGALKLKEISYIHCEAYAAGELKHGTISLITAGTPVIAVMTDPTRLSKTVSNVKETAARGAFIMVITDENTPNDTAFKYRILLPQMNDLTAPLGAAVILQLLAYYVALERGCDIDQPRNLAKSVTVE